MTILKNRFKVLETPKINSKFQLFKTLEKDDIIEIYIPIKYKPGYQPNATIWNVTKPKMTKRTFSVTELSRYLDKMNLERIN